MDAWWLHLCSPPLPSIKTVHLVNHTLDWQLEGEIWLQLEQLGLVPGMQLYLDGVSVTKQKDLVSVACKWKRIGWTPDEGWFIMTNLPDLESAILSYKKKIWH